MAKLCKNCSQEIADDALFCNHCGSKVADAATTGPTGATGGPNNQWANVNSAWTGTTTNEAFSTEDIQANRVVAGLAYFLFFLPLLICQDSRYGRFHANQGLVLLIISIAGSIVLSVIPIIGAFLIPLFSLAIFVFAIIGLINGLNGQAKELPVIGKWKILK